MITSFNEKKRFSKKKVPANTFSTQIKSLSILRVFYLTLDRIFCLHLILGKGCKLVRCRNWVSCVREMGKGWKSITRLLITNKTTNRKKARRRKQEKGNRGGWQKSIRKNVVGGWWESKNHLENENLDFITLNTSGRLRVRDLVFAFSCLFLARGIGDERGWRGLWVRESFKSDEIVEKFRLRIFSFYDHFFLSAFFLFFELGNFPFSSLKSISVKIGNWK